MYTQAEYQAESAICAKASAYADRFRTKGGWSVIGPVEAQHPDYKACDNDMRSRVEAFEFLRDLPARYSGYLSVARGEKVTLTTWTGQTLGAGWAHRFWRDRWGNRFMSGVVTVTAHDGRQVDYRFRGQGDGMFCSLRRIDR